MGVDCFPAQTSHPVGLILLLLSLGTLSTSCKSDGEGGESTEIGEADFSVLVDISDVIPTVGIIEWSADLDSIDQASIEYGLDTDYGMTAPVDLSEDGFRTLLLGMKPSSAYHLRVVAESDGTIYMSDDYTLETGPLINGLPPISMNTIEETAITPGFTVSNFVVDSTVFILDSDGDYVWWYETSVPEATRARMSYDGKYMLVGSNNVENNGQGELLKISMDGSEEESFDVPALHHDFTVLPGNVIGYIEFDEKGEGICDRIIELEEDGTKREVYSLRTDFSHLSMDQEWCHSNAIHHDELSDSYYLSVLDFNSILKIHRGSGTLQWVLGGDESDFDDVSWRFQHGHHVLENDRILLFNNGGNVWTNLSLALEFELDEDMSTASLEWEYEGGPVSHFQGDVQRLPGGNTLVVYSSAGVWHEVSPEGELLREISWSLDGVTGYAIFRESLYGTPPK